MGNQFLLFYSRATGVQAPDWAAERSTASMTSWVRRPSVIPGEGSRFSLTALRKAYWFSAWECTQPMGARAGGALARG